MSYNRKKLCILQVTPSEPTKEHVDLFADQEQCDFYFVTHDNPHNEALQFCPNTTWTDTRNILTSEVPKNYDYYGFVDYDYILRPLGELEPLQQILHDLDNFNPAILTYYPGKGLHTPFASNIQYRDSKEYSILPFTHAGFKIVHHSLIDWFFPMVTKFGGGVESCHLFNILELPFLKNVVCSHKMVYDNSVSAPSAPHNSDAVKSGNQMSQMWQWIKPSFKKTKLLDFYANNEHEKNHPLLVKHAFIDAVMQKQAKPSRADTNVNYHDIKRISDFFDVSHEWFDKKFGK